MRVLIVGEVNSDNLGDRAIYLTLEDLFKSEGCEVCGLDLSRNAQFHRRKDEPGRISTKNLYLEGAQAGSRAYSLKRCLRAVMREMQPDFIRKARVFYLKKCNRLKYQEEWTRTVKNSDIVVFGGGALLVDNYWSFPLALLYMSRLAKQLGVPYGCVGCSVGESFSFNGARWLTEFLKGCSFITVRDPMSGLRLQKLGVSGYKVFIDSAICISDIIKIERRLLTGNIGINVLSYVHHPKIRMQDYRRYIEVIKHLIVRVVETPKLGLSRVILFNTGGSTDTHAGELVHSWVSERLSDENIKACRRIKSLEQLCHVISQCDIVIGTRLHSSVISKSYGIPIIGIDWDTKVSGFYEMIGLKEFCFDYRTFDVEMLIKALERIKAQNLCQEATLCGHIREFKMVPDYVFRCAGVKEKA